MWFQKIGAKCARLEGCEPRAIALKRDVRDGFPLKHLADENQFAPFIAVADAVTNHALAEHGGKLWREIADLVSVWK